MDLHAYLSSPGSLSVRELATAIKAPDPAIVRQWLAKDTQGKFKRRPGAAYAAAIERATGGAVPRWDSRPDDWHQIWEHLIGAPGSPPIPAPQEATTAQG